MSNNISSFTDKETARTCFVCAKQRAENLAILGAQSVMELCVGPSLRILETVYKEAGIKQIYGNDIDKRWEKYYPQGKWIIGDARKVNVKCDALVVAPPLSKSCSGRREDSLSLEEANPSFYDFIHLDYKIIVYVLPGRTLSVQKDREQLYKFLSFLPKNRENNIVPLKNKVNKYIDIYSIKL